MILLIVAPPVRVFQDPPKDQPDCISLECPICLNLMWVSQKKRNMLKSATDINMMCWDCFSNKFGGNEHGDQTADC